MSKAQSESDRRNRIIERSQAETGIDRWLQLFRQTAREVCNPRAADRFIERAEFIARSIEMGVASNSGVLLARDQRFVRATMKESS